MIAIGLNTVREICTRVPLAMDEELLHVRHRCHRSAAVPSLQPSCYAVPCTVNGSAEGYVAPLLGAQDLVQYKNHREKGVMMAARSLVQA